MTDTTVSDVTPYVPVGEELMDPELKERWLKALRSGKYEQAKGALKQLDPHDEGSEEYGYCCLGVICDITPEWNWETTQSGYLPEVLAVPYFAKTYENRLNVAGVFTFKAPAGYKDFNSNTRTDVYNQVLGYETEYEYRLADLNDNGMTFAQIADLIEYFF
jgi:hypothetical protein